MSYYIQSKHVAFAGKTQSGKRVVVTMVYGGDNNFFDHTGARYKSWYLHSIAYSKIAHTERMINYIADLTCGAVKINGLSTTKKGRLSLPFSGFKRMRNLYDRAPDVDYVFPDQKEWSEEECKCFCNTAPQWLKHQDSIYIKEADIPQRLAYDGDIEKVQGILRFMQAFEDTETVGFFTKKFSSEMIWQETNCKASFQEIGNILYSFEFEDGMDENLMDSKAVAYHLKQTLKRRVGGVLDGLQRYPTAFDRMFEDYSELLDMIKNSAASSGNTRITDHLLYFTKNHKAVLKGYKKQKKQEKYLEEEVLSKKVVKIAKLAAEKAYYKNTYALMYPLEKELEKAVAIKRFSLREEQIKEIKSICYTLDQKKSDQEMFARKCKAKKSVYIQNADRIANVIGLFDTIIKQQLTSPISISSPRIHQKLFNID